MRCAGKLTALRHCLCDLPTSEYWQNEMYRAAEGAVDESECLPCPRGTVSATEGATQCDMSPPGSYTTDDPSDADGSGITIGASASVLCPTGRIAANEGSSSCEACPVGKTSVEGGTEVSRRVLSKKKLTLTLPVVTHTLTLFP